MQINAQKTRPGRKNIVFRKNKWFTQFQTETEDNVRGLMIAFIIVYKTCPPSKSRSDKSVLTCRILNHRHSGCLMFMMIHACGYFLSLIITLALQAIIYEALPYLSCRKLPVRYELVKTNFLCMQLDNAHTGRKQLNKCLY